MLNRCLAFMHLTLVSVGLLAFAAITVGKSPAHDRVQCGARWRRGAYR